MALAILTQNDFQYMHWYSAGKDFQKAHTLMETYYLKLQLQIDNVAEICLELGLLVPNPAKAGSIIPNYQSQSNVEYLYADVLRESKSIIEQLISAFNEARNSINDDSIQSIIDDYTRYWKKEVNYKIERTNRFINGFVNSGLDTYIVGVISSNR